MDWPNERYVRLYTRDTMTWLRLRFEGQALFCLLLRRCDRAGIIDIGEAEPWEAAQVHCQCSEEFARVGMQRLLDCKVFEHVNGALVLPNFVEAQEASMSQTMRQKEHRLKRRDLVRSGLDPSQRETAIYFIQSEHGGEVKIGRADDVAKRLVGLQTSRPDKLVLLAATPGTLQQERELHTAFSAHRVKGEWFSPTTELMSLVNSVAADGADALCRFLSSRNVTGDTEAGHVSSDPGHVSFAVTPSLAVPSLTLTPSGGGLSDSDSSPARKPEPKATDPVFEHWVRVMGKDPARTLLNGKRREKLRARRREGYTDEQLCQAVDGCRASAFHMGQNDRHEAYNDLETILRDGASVEKHIARLGPSTAPQTAFATSTVAIIYPRDRS